MYEERKHLTLTIILHALKEDDLFSGGRTSLAKLLKDMGFGYKKRQQQKVSLMDVMYCTYPKVYIPTCRYYFEQPRIIEQHLRRMRLNRQDKQPVVYLDETWANAQEKAWVEKDDITGGTIVVFNGRQVRVPNLFLILGQRIGGCLTVPWSSGRQVSNIKHTCLTISEIQGVVE